MNRTLAIAACAAALSCRNAAGPEPGPVRVGLWGAEDAGAIISDTAAHVHIGCTAGTFPGLPVADSAGRFSATGTYNIQLYPVQHGPDRPARIEGVVAGGEMELRVVLLDTAVTIGPVRVVFGREPGMVNCPICRKPGEMKTSSEPLHQAPKRPGAQAPIIHS